MSREPERAAAQVRRHLDIDGVQFAFVLGSGWATAARGLGDPVGELPLADLPGFTAPVVPGHGGELRLVVAPSGAVVALFTGRTHLYEGRGVDAAVQHVRTAAALGAKQLVLTNGCGGLRDVWPAGTTVLIADHLNLSGSTPLTGPEFIDLTDVYSPRLRDLARRVEPNLPEGVYCQFPGPAYETPAEVRMARLLGADLVGMSTAVEAIAARSAGMEVLGISLVTNLAAGVSDAPLDHAEVIAAGNAAGPRLRLLLEGLLTGIPALEPGA